MTDASERETLTWDGFGSATRDLARRILASGFEPEVVVAIARGGLLPAGAIAYGLGAKNCGAINVEFYTGIGTVLDAPEVLPPELDMAYLDGRRVLLVDDVADSGRTLALAVQLLQDKGADVRLSEIEPDGRDLVLVVGPEGGISDDELGRLTAAGAERVLLGDTVLRTSTAGPAAIAVLSVALGRW